MSKTDIIQCQNSKNCLLSSITEPGICVYALKNNSTDCPMIWWDSKAGIQSKEK